jgi:hypothetical protein
MGFSILFVVVLFNYCSLFNEMVELVINLVFLWTKIKPILFFYNDFLQIVIKNVKLVDKVIGEIVEISIILLAEQADGMFVKWLIKLSLKIGFLVEFLMYL